MAHGLTKQVLWQGDAMVQNGYKQNAMLCVAVEPAAPNTSSVMAHANRIIKEVRVSCWMRSGCCSPEGELNFSTSASRLTCIHPSIYLRWRVQLGPFWS